MISSVIDLWTEFNETLNVNGDRAFCLSEDDKVILCELQKFLKPFHDLTELVSSEQPHLGLIPLVVKEVQDATKLDPYESEVISTLKTTVNNRLGERIKVTEAVRIATVLDPTMKRLLLADAVVAAELKTVLVDLAKLAHDRKERASASVSNVSETPQAGCSRDDQPAQQVASKKMKLLEKFRCEDTSASDIRIENEVNTYMHLRGHRC